MGPSGTCLPAALRQANQTKHGPGAISTSAFRGLAAGTGTQVSTECTWCAADGKSLHGCGVVAGEGKALTATGVVILVGVNVAAFGAALGASFLGASFLGASFWGASFLGATALGASFLGSGAACSV